MDHEWSEPRGRSNEKLSDMCTCRVCLFALYNLHICAINANIAAFIYFRNSGNMRLLRTCVCSVASMRDMMRPHVVQMKSNKTKKISIRLIVKRLSAVFLAWHGVIFISSQVKKRHQPCFKRNPDALQFQLTVTQTKWAKRKTETERNPEKSFLFAWQRQTFPVTYFLVNVSAHFHEWNH